MTEVVRQRLKFRRWLWLLSSLVALPVILPGGAAASSNSEIRVRYATSVGGGGGIYTLVEAPISEATGERVALQGFSFTAKRDRFTLTIADDAARPGSTVFFAVRRYDREGRWLNDWLCLPVGQPILFSGLGSNRNVGIEPGDHRTHQWQTPRCTLAATAGTVTINL